MQFEKLRKSHKKEIVIGALAICIIGGALTFATTKAKYKLTESIDLVKGTINYKPYDFKIMAMYKSDDGTNYTDINEMPSEGYIINEEKTYCTTDNKNKVKGKIKTENGKHYITGLTKSDKCYLYFDIKVITIPEVIATLNAKTEAPDFNQIAEFDEGVYEVSDNMYGGTSYYWRGAATTNYVKFAGFCWRIIRINGDGTIRLIYDGTTCHANGTTADSIAKTNIVYNTSDSRSNYVGWTYEGALQRPTNLTTSTASNAKIQTEDWLSSNITGKNLEKVADGKFCNERRVRSGSSWTINNNVDFYYETYDRYIKHTPTFVCPSEDIYTLKIGAITIDEIMYAGGKSNTANDKYYLYNGQQYWTMSPSNWNGEDGEAGVFSLDTSSINRINVKAPRNLRPVINLKSDTKLASGGNGTQNNPYIVQ